MSLVQTQKSKEARHAESSSVVRSVDILLAPEIIDDGNDTTLDNTAVFDGQD
jgi:hypothetical protein